MPSPARSSTKLATERWRLSRKCRTASTTSVDATPLYVLLAGAYFERTGDLESVQAFWPNIVGALKWIDEFGDIDGDGLIEYKAQVAPKVCFIKGGKTPTMRSVTPTVLQLEANCALRGPGLRVRRLAGGRPPCPCSGSS